VHDLDPSLLTPLHPALHLAPRQGWMNDPNGLCFVDGRYHAFFQHDPGSDTHGPMHWGHASSIDLLRWDEHEVALAPDALGLIFSGSMVIDDDDTAGFGAGAMIAVFTHDLAGRQSQSLAISTDHGTTWRKFDGNPVLVSDDKDFRDPKVLRVGDAWLMALAVGRCIEFYTSDDLISWEKSGRYGEPIEAPGVWECPDIVRLADRDLLVFSVADGGPYGHGGTLCVEGVVNADSFEPTGSPALLDHGPDFYAAQSFHRAPGPAPVTMAWLNSWHYATVLPSHGRRGVMSLPRSMTWGDGRCLTAPAADLGSLARAVGSTAWTSRPGAAVIAFGAGAMTVEVTGAGGEVATVEITGDSCSVDRHGDVADGYRQRYETSLPTSGAHLVLIDHGTIEVFAAGGSVATSALTFPGEQWGVRVSGTCALAEV
jgi:sucrose-6-phosphate hydrolase SacC (GH32 family)